MASSFAQLLAEKDDGLFGEDDEFGALAPAAKQRPAAHHGAAAPVQAGTVPPPALPAVVGQEAGTTTAGHGPSHLDGHTMVSATSLVAAPLTHHAAVMQTHSTAVPTQLHAAPVHVPAQPQARPAEMQLALVPAQGALNYPKPADDAKFFIIKSYNHDNIGQSITTGVWSTQAHNESKLGAAFASCSEVLLVFSVNGSGHFQGYARMETPIGRAKGRWAGDHTRQLGSLFGIQWMCLCDVPFAATSHMYNPLNEGKPVKISRDGQELPHGLGCAMVQMFEKGAAEAGIPRPKPRPEVEWEETDRGDVVPAGKGEAPAWPAGASRDADASGRRHRDSDRGGRRGDDRGGYNAAPTGPPPGWWGPPPGYGAPWAGGWGTPPMGWGMGPPPYGQYPQGDGHGSRDRRRRSRSRSRSPDRRRGDKRRSDK